MQILKRAALHSYPLHYMTIEQKNLYEHYSALSKAIIENARSESKSLNETIWNALSMEGMWALPIDEGLGGCFMRSYRLVLLIRLLKNVNRLKD